METLFLALRVLVALGAILAVIWFVQRKVTGAGGKSAGGRKSAIAGRFGTSKRGIQVLGTHRLGAKASISVVEVDGVKLVLGVTEHGISVLEPAPVPQPAAPAAGTIAHPEAIAPESDLTQVAVSAAETLAAADARKPGPDFADALAEALAEVSAPRPFSTVAETVAPAVTDGERRWRRGRMSVPMLRQQLLPHVTRTLAGAIGIQIYPSALDQPVVPILAPAVVTTPAVPVAVTPVAVTPVAVTPVAVTPVTVASVAPRPRVATAHLAAYAAAAEQTAPVTPAAPVLKPARNYDDAVPFFERLPVLQRAS